MGPITVEPVIVGEINGPSGIRIVTVVEALGMTGPSDAPTDFKAYAENPSVRHSRPNELQHRSDRVELR